ncbi:MAG: hypothetical protein LBF49_01210 [Puniceicoccales bacterium]|jgi:hypothetical protein|nr:hypothetical protein [Puniceicoccales bacterium]
MVMCGTDNSNVVKIFSKGTTTCVASKNVASKFYGALTNLERTKIIEGFIKDRSDFDIDTYCEYTFDGVDKEITMEYFREVTGKAKGKFVQFKIIELEIAKNQSSK